MASATNTPCNRSPRHATAAGAAHHLLSPRQRGERRGDRVRPQRRDQHGHDAARRARDGYTPRRRRPWRALELMRERGAPNSNSAEPGVGARRSHRHAGHAGHRASRRGGRRGCRLALAIFAHRVRKYIGAYAATMGGVDAIVFTGGIGENSALVRHRCLQRLEFLGAVLAEDRTATPRSTWRRLLFDHLARRLPRAAPRGARGRGGEMATGGRTARRASHARPARLPIAVSARHAHLSQATIDRLFGAGYTLQPRTPLSQTGQFSAQETITLSVRVAGSRTSGYGSTARSGPDRDLAQRRIRARR